MLQTRVAHSSVIHELLHTHSMCISGMNIYNANKYIEEGSVEFFAKEIARKEGIAVTSSGYDPFVQVLKESAKYCGKDNYNFAKELFEIPLNSRLKWLTDEVNNVYLNNWNNQATAQRGKLLLKILGETFND